MAKRDLEVVATGVQSYEGRFGKRRRYENGDAAPPISPWRCNLTGLSQEHNLYFVAYGRDVYVYAPRFPSQRIAREPVLIVPSQPSRHGLQGYLDPREPHTINNLVVQFLGNDEVIATVRDDGDVEAVLVRHVRQAIKTRSELGSTIGLVADEIKPIFQSNVGISAWGLAIHTEARILATSSNAHEVRIFKFGLLHEEECLDKKLDDPAQSGNQALAQDGERSSEYTVPDGSNPASTHVTTPGTGHRHMDVTQRLLNGGANIPYIGFCNTGDDPQARWLLTTDISGYCRIMDLHNMQEADVTVQQFRFGRNFPNGSGFDRINAGWGIMFLDPRSFLVEESFWSAVGLSDGASLPGANKDNATLWDLSDMAEKVPDSADVFWYENPRPQESERRSAAEGPGDRQQGSSTASDSQSEDSATDREFVTEEPLIEIEEGNIDDDITVASSVTYDDQTVLDENDDAEYETIDDNITFKSLYGGKRIFGNQPYFYSDKPLCEDLPCPLLHAAVKNIYLLQPSNQRYKQGPFVPPMVGMANPMRQSIQTQLGYLNMFDRLNMNVYIPSLGVVILASQKGRALVLSLTKLCSSAEYPSEMREQAGKTNFAMRIELILPLASQEMRRERPFAPLHGIAASPIQGAGSKRWRLMMMYQDHSILSYELSRAAARDSAVDIDAVVV